MQVRRTIYALLASITVFYLYLFIVSKVNPPPPPTTQPVETAGSTTRPATATATATTGTAPSEPRPAPKAAPAATVHGAGADEQKSIVLGSAEKGNPFPMAVEIASHGAAVCSVNIRGHYLTVARDKPYPVLSPISLPGEPEPICSFETPRVRFHNLDIEVHLDDLDWTIERVTEHEAVLAVRIDKADGTPLARVVKRYQLTEQPADTRTYDLQLFVDIENLSSSAVDVILTQQGPVGLHKEDPRYEDRRVIGAVWEQGILESKGHTRDEIIKKPQHGELGGDNDSTGQRIAWAAGTNRYFACIMAPAGRVSSQDGLRFSRVEASAFAPQVQHHAEDLTFRYITVPTSVPAGGKMQTAFDCYIGPKSKRSFDRVPIYNQRNYYETIRESFYICAPDVLVGLMMNLLDTFHKIPPHNYGLAIIILVLLVRGILHPITKKSQVNMLKLQGQQARLKPKLDAIKEKYGNDRVKLNQAMMQVYRDEGINPAGNVLACLPMMLQLPIWAALWTALASTIEMRHAAFDPWWIRDLAGPDAVHVFSKPITLPLLGYLMGEMTSLNLLPVLLGVSQLLQAKYMPHSKSPTPRPDGAPDQMEQQRKMMMFMSVFFVLLLYNAPSGLNLYIMSSNIFGIVEQWRIRKHLAVVEAREAVLVASGKKPPRKPSRMGQWLQQKWANLEKEAEDARRVQSSRKKKSD